MKININKKKLICVLISGFVIVNLVGCSKNTTYQVTYQYDERPTFQNNTSSKTEITDNSYENEKNESLKETPTEESQTLENQPIEESLPSKNQPVEDSQPSKEQSTEEKQEQNESTNSYEEEKTEYTNNDQEAINAFDKLQKNIDDILNSETVTNVKDKVKGAFVTVVDFLFYDSEINGITFDELTDAGKQKVLQIANAIDTKIESKFPNYKDTIADGAKNAFNKASELIKKGANNVKEFSKDKLGEDNYNAIVDVKDEIVEYTKKAIDIIGDFGSNIFNKGKEYIKEWYENFRN